MKFASIHGKIRSIAGLLPDQIAIESGTRQISYDQLEREANRLAVWMRHQAKGEQPKVLLFMEKSPELITAILAALKSGTIFVPLDPNYPVQRLALMVEELAAESVLLFQKDLDKWEQVWDVVEGGVAEQAAPQVLTLDEWFEFQLSSDPEISATSDGMLEGRPKLNQLSDNVHRQEVQGDASRRQGEAESRDNLPNQQNSQQEWDWVSSDQIRTPHAYIYFTSGSTGRPKGVLGRHQSLFHFIAWESGELQIDQSFRFGQLTSPSFDPYLRDILVPLISGATICIPEDQELLMQPGRLVEWIDQQQIHFFHLTPSLFKTLMAQVADETALSSVKMILLAGEMLRGNDLAKFFQLFGQRIMLGNLYGPTETTLAKFFYRVQPEDQKRVNVPVGQGIPGAQALILDEEQRRCRVGQVGEVYIRTPFISSGYYNRPELTRQVFVPNPYGKHAKDIIYKTGDLGRILPSGDLELLGRKDQQVKVRGVRVEPGEIEQHLLAHPEILETVVLAKENDQQEAYLAAYLVSREEIRVAVLRSYLAQFLPEYMIPDYFVQLERMPLNPNGKVDRKALPDPVLAVQQEREYQAPVGQLEERLAVIWQEILRVEQVGRDDHFFELGGHSLRAVTLLARVYQEFQVELALRDIFASPLLFEQAQLIEEAWGELRELRGDGKLGADSGDEADDANNANGTNVSKGVAKRILPIPDRDYYPLSSGQERLFLLQKLDETQTSYHIPNLVLIQGQLNLPQLERAFRALIERHEVLRSSFQLVDGEPMQQVHPKVEFRLESAQVKLPLEGQDGEVRGRDLEHSLMQSEEVQKLLAEFVRPFDLSQPPLLRAKVIQVGPEKYLCLFDCHHIIADGTSTGIMIRELLALYEGDGLPPLSLQYRDYAVWQRQNLQSESFAELERYWLDQFSGIIPVLNLPTDKPRLAVQRYVGAKLAVIGDANLQQRLEVVAREEGVTLYMIFLAAYALLLAEYSGQQDLVIGTPLAGRGHTELQPLLGMFINTLALRTQLDRDWTVQELLGQIKELTLEVFAHQDYPFETLVEKLQLRRDLSRNPLFDTMLIYQNMEIPELVGTELTFTGVAFEHPVSKVDLSLIIQPRQEGLEFAFEYSTDLFERETIGQLAQHFLHLLEEMTVSRDRLWRELGLLSKEEQLALIQQLNQTQVELTETELVHQQIARQAQERPDQVALVCGQEVLTYRELDLRGTQLALMLRQSGVTAETVVGVLVERSVDLIVALLGVLKAGGAYLPLDPAYPQERLQTLLADSEAALLVTSDPKVVESLTFTGTVLNLADLEWKSDLTEEVAPLREVVSADNLAYLIYTSGSTGQPKGVMVEHRSLLNFIAGMNEKIDFAPGKTILSLTTVSFDIFFLETLLPLTQGMRVILGTTEEQQMADAFQAALALHQVDILQITPSRMQLYLQSGVELTELARLEALLLGGEALPHALLEQIRVWRPQRIFNLYGPTETTIWSTVADLTEADEITIGQPIANTQVLLLNQGGQIVPPKVPGELCIGGAGLARGYSKQPHLTGERFQSHEALAGRRLYRTGDLARWRADGQLEFLGRIDQQVKVRGYRIEPGEIETKLRELPGIRDAVVVARNDHSGVAVLCGYLVLDQPKGLEAAESFSSLAIRNQLAKILPEYMVPTYLISLEALPLTANGKIDRRALPAPQELEVTTSGGTYLPPRNSVERKLTEIWAKVLGLNTEELGINDHFFERGGHSLKAVQVVTQIRQEFAVSIGMIDLFQNPTIAQLAQWINGEEELVEEWIPVQPEQPHYPVSYAQQRLWVLEQKNPDTSAYHLSATYYHPGRLSKESLETACQLLIHRHESLRTSFTVSQGEPVQVIWPKVDFALVESDLTQVTEEEEREAQITEIHRQALLTPFDLEKAPLFRVCLIREEEGKDQFFFVMHHLISDGWSMDIFQRELQQLYTAAEAGTDPQLPPLPIQYRDFASWQRDRLASEALAKHRQFWAQQLGADVSPLQLPTDYPYQSLFRDRAGAGYRFQIAEDTLATLHQVARENEASLYMVLLAGFMTMLGQLTDQEDVLVSAPVAGREHQAVEGLIGFFLNTLILRGEIGPKMEFGQVLAQVRENTLQALEYQGYPFELLTQELGLEQEAQGPLVTSIFFNMLNFANSGQGELTLTAPSHRPLGNRMKFDLGCYVQEYANGLEFDCHYRTGLFKPATIAYIMGEYQRLLSQIGANPQQTVSEFELFSVARLTRDEPRLERPRVTPATQSVPTTLVSAFEAQVRLHPERIAVQGAKGTYTYRSLNKIANRIAHTLIESFGVTEQSNDQHQQKDQLAAVREEDLSSRADVAQQTQVALLFEHDLELVAGIFGVLKAGQIYVPLDPTYPEQRLAEIMIDAGTTCIVTNDQNLFLAKKLVKLSQRPEMTIINLQQVEQSESQSKNPQLAIQPDQLAYLLYTSGSTGKPKGVMQSHRNVLHFIRTYAQRLEIGPKDRLTLFSSYGFDAAVMDLYGAILNGATLYLYSIKEEGNLARLGQWLQEEQITIYHSIPTVFRYFVDTLTGEEEFPALRLLVMGGEALTKGDFELYCTYFGPHTQLINGLGPTESTVTLQYWMNQQTEITSSAIPVGYPVEETEVFLWTEEGQEARVYQVGELIFKSPYLALGYWQRPDETSRAFSVDPRTGTERVYRSGDLGVRLPDGKIQFMGRKDFQVKIRGYRIETAEIEQVLDQLPTIAQSVVAVHQGVQGESQLVAYYRVQADTQLTSREIKQFLTSRLPSYMVPTDYICLEKFPQTQTGKIDRRALPDPTQLERSEGADLQLPETEWEQRLAQIWSEVLGVAEVDRRDDFFALGGHSLKAIALAARIGEQCGVELPLHQIFAQPDLQGMAKLIQQADQVAYQKIAPVESADTYPVSSAQKRMFILYQMDPDRTQYNMPRAMLIEGQVEGERLERAFYQLIQRHESLRTSFHLMDGEPVQRVHDQVEFQIEEAELAEADIANWLQKWVRPFELSQAPLLRVALVELTPERYLLAYDLHHIISDGVSQVNLMNDFVSLYQGMELEELPIQYKDYAHWQNQFLASKEQQIQEEYWLERFAQLPPMLELPTDYPRPALMSDAGDWYRVAVEEELALGLYQLAHSQGATLYMVLLAAYHLLLTRYAGEQDTVVGLPIAGRSKSAELEKLIGIFVNILPMRNQAEAQLTFGEFLQQVKENALTAYEYQDYQFELLVERLKLGRNLSRHPLFDTVLVLQNMEQKELTIPGLTFQPYVLDTQLAKFDLTLNVIEQDGELLLTFYYCTDLFKKSTIARMGEHLLNIFREIVAQPTQKLGQMKVLSTKEEQKLLERWNVNAVNYPRELTIHQLFAEQVAMRPNRLALSFGDQEMTYRELDQRANQVARRLRGAGVGPDQIVGLLLERSLEMIVGVLAVLKAGGAYLPLDPHYPLDRLEYMLADSQTQIMLTTPQELAALPELTFTGQVIELSDPSIDQQSGEPLAVVNQPDDLAYIIYTSGSTGRPKGVIIEHRNVVRLLFNDQFQFDFSEKDVWSLFHSYCFDFSVWEMYGALLYGGRLVIIPKLTAQDPANFLRLLVKEGVTVLNQTPTAFAKLTQAELERAQEKSEPDLQIRYVIFGGEALKPLLLRPWNERYPKTKLINMYGITETTVHVTYKEITAVEMSSNVSNIGTPIPTLATYLLDEELMLVPAGVVGEICVGGAGVARGYLNRPELTAERFIANPYRPEERLYRSGDLARFLPNGELEYLGRRDRQVKIRGFRIELGEIEGQLLRHPLIQDAVLIDGVDQSGDVYLAAYLVTDREGSQAGDLEVESTSATVTELTVTELRAYLAQELPEYMIPAYFIYIREIPLTSNGKVDRRALPEPDLQGQLTGIEYQPPTNSIESRLVEIWSEILEVEGIGVTANFFELGGHSLKATTLVSRITKEWQVELALKEVFTHPTIRELAELIQGSQQSGYQRLTPIEEREFYPVSSAQKRLLVLQQMIGETTSYNLPSALIVQGELDTERLEKVICQLIQRHESLHTSFGWVDGEPVQRIQSEVEFELTQGGLIRAGEAEEVIRQFIRPFDLTQAPLLRVGLFPLEKDNLLIFDLHHIIADGVSLGNLIQEFGHLYQGGQLTKLNLQYKDFAVWQQEQLQDGFLQEQGTYWIEEFATPLAPLELPLDYPRPELMDYHGGRVHFQIQAELRSNLAELAKDQGVTMYMLLLAGYQALLARYGLTEDLAVGTPIAGRSHPDLEEVLGMFVNTLPIRTQPVGSKPFAHYLQEVKDQILTAHAHQDYPFDLLVEQLQVAWDLSRHPLFDTVFVLENEPPRSTGTTTGLVIEPYPFDHSIAKFDLTWRGFVRTEEIRCHLEYRTSLFTAETISQLATDYLHILEQIVANPELTIGELAVQGGVQQLDEVNIDDLDFDF